MLFMNLSQSERKARIQSYMTQISQALIKARLSGMCLYASVLLKEKLLMDGIVLTLVPGYLQTDRGRGELFRHVWLEDDTKNIYDLSLDVLKVVSWQSDKVKYQHHKTIPSHLKRTDHNATLDYGISLYQRDPYQFWSEFDNCNMPDIHRHIAPVINQLRDMFLGLD